MSTLVNTIDIKRARKGYVSIRLRHPSPAHPSPFLAPAHTAPDPTPNRQQTRRRPCRAKQVNFHAHSKKTAKRARNVHKQVKVNKKKNKAALSDESNGGLFPAINLLHDPQGTVEKVFRRLRQSKQRFEVRPSCDVLGPLGPLLSLGRATARARLC